MAAKFELVDERDIHIESEARGFRVAHWWGDSADSLDLSEVAVYESTDGSLDEVIAWAKQPQSRPARVTEIFALVGHGSRAETVLICTYDYR